MCAVIVTATTADIRYLPNSPTPLDALPSSEMSSDGSDVSSSTTPAHEPAPVKLDHQIPLQSMVQDCSDKTQKSQPSDFDLRLVTRFVELMGIKVQCSLTGSLSEHFAATPSEVGRAVRLLFRCLRLLRLCDYPEEDMEVIFAKASTYMRDIVSQMQIEGQAKMRLTETVHVMSVLVYLAHVYCEDKTCPVSFWHRHIFQQYCTLQTLNAAILGLFGRLRFQLRVDEAELESRLSFIRQGGEAPIS